VKAWLELPVPASPIELPDGPATLVLGRSPRCTLVFDDRSLSAKHAELKFDGSFWALRDLGSTSGCSINKVQLRGPQALFPDDVIRLGQTQLVFRQEALGNDGPWLEALQGAPDDDAAWLVYADWLLERGDALGDRLVNARAGQRLNHQPWLGPLWPAYVSGALELEWRLGMVAKATVRSIAGQLPINYRQVVSALFGSRVGRLVRSLTVDVLRLESPGPAEEVGRLEEAAQVLVDLPHVPTTLEHISLGYAFRPRAQLVVPWPLALRKRLPRLAEAPLFLNARGARLTQVQVSDVARFVGLTGTTRALTDLTRLRKGERRDIHLETPPGMPFIASDGNPCFFAPSEGGWSLTAGRLRGEVRVNGRNDAFFRLLPGDTIEVLGAGSLRFELAA
jgi:uncharacterized protein (TIGR02996 family)